MHEDSEARELSVDESVREFVDEMIDCLGWDLQTSLDGNDRETLRVELRGEDRELLVQNRAEVLEAVQYLLNRVFGRDLGERRLLCDSEGYRERKESELREIASRVCERVLLSGKEEELGLMNPYERRIVHLAVAEREGVTTASSGDGLMKRVIILPS